MTHDEIRNLERNGILNKNGFDLVLEDVIISSEDIPGWAVASEGVVTVALDITVTEELRKEGLARDFVNRVQNLRKDMGLQVLDKIAIEVGKDAMQNGQSEMLVGALSAFDEYIRTETQATSLDIKDRLTDGTEVDMDEFVLKVKITLKKQQ